MAGTQVNLFSVGTVDLTSMMDTLDRQRITFHALSLTHYDDTALPAIAAGSHEEVAGTLFKFTSEEAITGWAGVAVGVAYIKLVPAGTDPDTVTAEFTDTAPTWSDAKQSYYGTGGSANHRYIATLIKIDAGTYQAKDIYRGRYGERGMRSRMRVTKNDAQSIPNASATIVQYDDEDFDNLGEFASYRFTAKEAGYYFVSASLQSASAAWATGEYWELRIYKNGVFYSSGRQSRLPGWTGVVDADVIDIVQLDATEYIDIRCYQTEGAAVNTGTNATSNFLAVHRLS